MKSKRPIRMVKSELLRLIREDRLEECFIKINNQVRLNGKNKVQLIMLENRHRQNEQDFRRMIITKEVRDTEKQRVVQSLLEFIQAVEQEQEFIKKREKSFMHSIMISLLIFCTPFQLTNPQKKAPQIEPHIFEMCERSGIDLFYPEKNKHIIYYIGSKKYVNKLPCEYLNHFSKVYPSCKECEIYIGEMKDGLREGRGILYDAKGRSWEGTFRNNILCGPCTYREGNIESPYASCFDFNLKGKLLQ